MLETLTTELRCKMGNTLVPTIVLLGLAGFILFLIVLSMVQLFKIPKFSLREAREVASQSKENRPVIGGLLIADIFVIIIYPFFLIEIAPTSVLINIFAGVNAFFLFIILWRYIATKLAYNRIKQIEMYGDENE